MNTLEYQKLISSLDDQLERVKKEAEAKQKREALEQHIKLINHQLSSFEARKAEFDKFGVKPPFDIEPVLTRLRAEKVALEKQLVAPEEPPPIPGEWKLPDADRDEACSIADEVTNTNVSVMPEVERWLVFEIWAIRWRMIVDRANNPAAATNHFMRRTYAKIVETIQSWKATDAGWFIDALDRTKSGPGYDWQGRLDGCHRRLTELMEARRKEREAEEEEAKAIDLLENAIGIYAQNQTGESFRSLCHGVRAAARFEHLREDVAGMVEGWKDLLFGEFAFLWQNGKAEEPLSKADEKKVANREVVRRIITRLRSKGCIGSSHAPAEKMWKGFPTHDQARAKECLDMLVKNGVIRSKNTGIGPRVSLETGMVMRADAFAQGKEMGIKAVDDWCRKEEV